MLNLFCKGQLRKILLNQTLILSIKFTSFFKKIWVLFAGYPKEFGLDPNAFAGIVLNSKNMHSKVDVGTVVFQSVPDKFYFLLFGGIREHLRTFTYGRAEVVVTKSISGAVGSGWLAELKRLFPISWLSSRPWIKGYGTLIDGVAYRCTSWTNPKSDLLNWIKSKRLWHFLQQQHESYSLQINGIEVADLIIDTYLRFKPAPNFEVSDPFVRKLIWQALRDVQRAQDYFKKIKPRFYFTTYTTYIEHGIPARVALNYGVDVWAFGNLNRFGKQLTLTDTYHTNDFSKYRAQFEVLDQKIERLRCASSQLEGRLSGGIDSATSYMRQSAYVATNINLPENLDQAVVVFLHDFYDSPHVYPDLVFDDFWSWICFTVETFLRSGANFFLKPHPNQIRLSDLALIQLRERYPYLKWLPAEVSNVELVRAGIVCGVTVYGTVAHELAYLGIPSICCARHPHHTFDFCRTARNKQEYESFLMTYREITLPKEEMRRQALIFYYMHNIYEEVDERKLQQVYLEFWRSSNLGIVNQESMMQSYRTLVRLPAFRNFVEALVDNKKTKL